MHPDTEDWLYHFTHILSNSLPEVWDVVIIKLISHISQYLFVRGKSNEDIKIIILTDLSLYPSCFASRPSHQTWQHEMHDADKLVFIFIFIGYVTLFKVKTIINRLQDS